MLKLFSRIPDRDNYIITKSTPEQYSSPKIKINEISIKIKSLCEYKNATVVFDDILRSSVCKYNDQFHNYNNLDIFYLSQSYFDLLKRTIRNIS